MEMKNVFALVMPYYGELPWYFNYFLKSLEGKNLDVLFITDLQIGKHPDNFKVIRMSEQDVLSQIEKRLNRKVLYDGPYKFCDFKPMYGVIFGEYLRGYEYWGYGDCDLVFGEKINAFIAERIKENRDVVGVRKWWLSGPFCMLKNNARINSLYLQASSLADVFTTGKCVGFDELGGMWYYSLMAGTMTMEECEQKKDYFTETIWRQTDLNFYHDEDMNESDLSSGFVRVQNGRILVDGRDWPIYHMINMKRRLTVDKRSFPYEHIGNYYIGRIGFIHSEFVWKFRRVIELYRFAVSKTGCAMRYWKVNGTFALLKRFFQKVSAI